MLQSTIIAVMGDIETYEVVAEGSTLPSTDLATSMKVSLARNETQTWITIDDQLAASGQNVLTANFNPNRLNQVVQVAFDIPTGVSVKPVIKVKYEINIALGFTAGDDEELVFRQEVWKNYARPVPQPINQFLDFASVDFGTGNLYQTAGSQSYLINQLFKSLEERQAWCSRLDGNCNFQPFGNDNTVDSLLAVLSPTPFDFGGIEVYAFIDATNLRTTYRIQDVLAIEPFMSAFHGEQSAGFTGLSNLFLKLQFSAQHFNKIVQFRLPTCMDETNLNFTEANITNVEVGIEWVEFQTAVAPLARGISNHHYQRLEVFTQEPFIGDAFPKKCRVQVQTNSIPQYFIARIRFLDGAFFYPVNFDGSVNGFMKMTVRVSDLGQQTAVLDYDQLTANMYKRTCAGALIPRRARTATTRPPPWIVFDPVADMPGHPRAAGMAAYLVWDFEFELATPTASNNGLHQLEVIAVHYNPAGNRTTRFEASMSNFTQDEVIKVFHRIADGSIKVTPQTAN